MTNFRNKITIDTRVLIECQKKIDKTRFYKLIKKLNESVSADGVHPELMDEHDTYFEPRSEAERDLWLSCRNLAKEDMENLLKYSKAGKKGAEIRKQKKEESVMQQIEPAAPTVQNKDVIDTESEGEKEEKKAKAHNMLEIFGNAYKGTDAVVGVFERPDGATKEGIQIKNPRLMAFVRQRFDKQVLNKVSDWAIDHNQRGHTYNAASLLKLFCKFQRDAEPTINFNSVQAEYLTFEYKGE